MRPKSAANVTVNAPIGPDVAPMTLHVCVCIARIAA